MFWCRLAECLGDKHCTGATVCHNPSGAVVQHSLNAATAPHLQSPEPTGTSQQSHWHRLVVLQQKQAPSLPSLPSQASIPAQTWPGEHSCQQGQLGWLTAVTFQCHRSGVEVTANSSSGDGTAAAVRAPVTPCDTQQPSPLCDTEHRGRATRSLGQADR